MPLLYVYDGTGNVVITATATSVSSDGSQATFPFPSTLEQNGYSLAIVNQTGTSAGLIPAGDNLLSIAASQTIAGNPFGVSVGAQTVAYTRRQWLDTAGTGQYHWVVSTGTNYNTFPVVSLYSSNQVLINGTAVGVGQNPTAVMSYPSSSVTTSGTTNGVIWSNTYSGNTRAVVANSGGNTVSILDIVNDAVLDTLTVGNQPVALVVSPDGTMAYVANYTDGTVTEVNLSTNAPVTTVAVGGQPTSVALAAPSTLWVGGVGFLTQINTQNMSVVATQSTGGRTISGLGYTDAENEIVATTTDTSGNVNVDEVNPIAVRPGTLYTPAASHQVSRLGSYLNPRTQAMVRGFTGTLSQSSIAVNTNQASAPPLVVQDGWAAVTEPLRAFQSQIRRAMWFSSRKLLHLQSPLLQSIRI